MNYHVLAYFIYLSTTMALTVWVGHTLFKNGKIFLLDIFDGRTEMAESVDKLLLTGFYLINFGYAVHAMIIFKQIDSYQILMEVLSKKVGTIILILGAMHFLNMFIFFKLKKNNHPSFDPYQKELS